MNIERIKAILTIVITAAVNIANLYGYAIDAGQAVNAVLTFFSFACIIWSWWFNQNITDEAQRAQEFLNELKAAKRDEV